MCTPQETTQIYEGANQIERLSSMIISAPKGGRRPQFIGANLWAAVVETVVRTLWEALKQRGQRGTQWTIAPDQVGHARTRWDVWDGFRSSHNPEVN